MKFPDIRLPKLKFHRADEVLPETMTSRIIALVILSILVVILAWYGLGLLQFAGGAFSGSVSNATSSNVGGLTIGGVSLRECMGKITFWKVFFTLLAVLLTWAIGYPIMARNLAVQNQGKDNRHLLQYPNDQHIQTPEVLTQNSVRGDDTHEIS